MNIVLPYHQESLDNEVEVQTEGFAFSRASHNLDHFFSQLEIGTLKLQVACRRNIKNKPKVDVYKVALVVNQDIPIVTVFYL